jgi:fructosamine-3-kinase
MSTESIIKDLGLSIQRIERISGGDINEAYCLQTKDKKYFLKVNSASAFPNMFAKEARGLTALITNSRLQIPNSLAHGITGDQQYLQLEWLERGVPGKDFWEDFGTSLALMHKNPQAYFGFEEDNFIGSLHQNNTKRESWSQFYAEERILRLVDKLIARGDLKKEDRTLAEKLCSKLDSLFPKETPSLLHGDLWSGNFMCAANGKAALYDPAVYYGHREMDIGMTKLFGGFDQQFYEAYNATYPMENGWEERVPLTQLYPLLVHAVLFGGGYAGSARSIVKQFA